MPGAGLVRWWLPGELLGRGPFRWRVYLGEEMALLGTSVLFNLPDAAGETLEVEVALDRLGLGLW